MTRDDTRSLMYISRSELGGDIGALEQLRQQCVTRNRCGGVSGVLYYDTETFLQILEGPDGQIDALFLRIRQDGRHRDVHVLWDSFPPQRMFGQWEMKFVSGISSPELPDLIDRDALISGDEALLMACANLLRAA